MGNIEKLFTTYSDLESVIILNDVNRYYFCGYDASFGVLFLTPKKSFFITDARYLEEAKTVASSNYEVVLGDFNSALEFIKTYVSDNAIKSIGFENKTILFSEYNEIKKISNVEFVPVSDKILSLRAIKDENEIELIREASRISDKALLALQKKIKAGVTEREVLAELEYQMRLLGAHGVAFDTIVAFGKRTAFPHAHSDNTKLEKGMHILIDFGAKYNHYCSDMTRILSLGEPSSEIKALHADVLYAQNYALSAMTAGLTGREIDSFAREYLKSCGYGDKFTHSLGHGLGLEIHESPAVSPKNFEELQENMVVTCEPGVYIEGLGGIRIEDTVLIKNNGIELLNSVSKEIIIL